MSTLNDGLVHASMRAGTMLPDVCMDTEGTGSHIQVHTATVASTRDRLEFNGVDSTALMIHSDDTNARLSRVLDTPGRDFTIHKKVVFNQVTDRQYVLAIGNATMSQRVLIVYFHENGTLVAAVDDEPTLYPAISLTTPVIGQEYQITITYDQATLRLYVDDDVVVEVAAAGPLHTVTDTYWPHFGSRPGGTRWFDGTLRDFTVWSRAITNTERIELHDGWQPPMPSLGTINIAMPAGQSNGRCPQTIAALTWPEQLPANQRRLSYDYLAPNYRATLHQPAPQHAQLAGCGPEPTLADTLGDDWFVLQTCVNGTNLHTDWQPDGSSYLAAKAAFEKAIADLEELGYTIGKIAIIHIAGTADSGASQAQAEAYAANFETFADGVAGYTGKDPLVVISRIGEGQRGNASYVHFDEIRNQQAAIVADDPTKRVMVDADAFATSDGSHYTADAQAVHGRMLGKALLELNNQPVAASSPRWLGGRRA